MPTRAVDPDQTRAAVLAVADWLRDDTRPTPGRHRDCAGGAAHGPHLGLRRARCQRRGENSAFRCGAMHFGPAHRRGTPPNVVETDPRTWLLLATGLLHGGRRGRHRCAAAFRVPRRRDRSTGCRWSPAE